MNKVNDYLRKHGYFITEGLLLVDEETGKLIEWFYDHDEVEEYVEQLENKEEA